MAEAITGGVFGRLTAVAPTDQRKHKSIVCRCTCVCGGTAYVPRVALTKGRTKSCGCLKPGTYRSKEEKRAAKQAYERAHYGLTGNLAARERKLARGRRRYASNTEAHNIKARGARFVRLFGLTLADYEALHLAQGGLCAICQQSCATGRRLAVDHDHATNVVRGLLCYACNVGLGHLRDSPDNLRAAAAYLEASWE